MRTSVAVALALAQGEAPVGPGADRPADDAAAEVRAAIVAEKAGRSEAARRSWLAAARAAPSVADWLRLRAAGSTGDSGQREALYASLTTPPARARITAVEAAARERTGDLAGAILRLDTLGRPGDVLRLRLRLATTPAARAAIRRELTALVDRRPATAESERAGVLLATTFAPVTPDEALRLARLAVDRRQTARALPHYARGLAATGATAEDSLAYVSALRRAGRSREAIAAATRIAHNPAVRAAVLLERARAELRLADRGAADATLAALVRLPGDAAAVAEGLRLRGDVAWDDGRLEEARTAFLEAYRRAPERPEGVRAAFQAALAAWALDRPEEAAREWERLRREHPRADAAAAAGYWAGRAWRRLGDEARARRLWESVRATDSLSYYAVVSAERLGTPPWAPDPAADRFERFADLDAAMERVRLLDALGLTPEAGLERDWLAARAAESVERRLATARAFHAIDQPTLGVRLARAALAAGAPADARTYRLIYPFPMRDEIRALAEEAGLDPMLIAALTRQESMWEARARSSAGARGLMQVMPATGDHVARRLRLPAWSPERLYEPTTNLRLGTAYFAERLQRCGGDQVCALAAYNAGPGRIARWMARPGGGDRDLLLERMAFAETRDYVRVVHRNLAMYHALYGEAAASQTTQ